MFRVIGHHHRAAHVFLGQPALVLGLQVQAPFHRELEFLVGLLQQGDGIAVVDALERRIDEGFQARDRIGLHALGDEGQVVATFVQHGAEHVLQKVLGQLRVGSQVVERDFRFDHPELGQVARGVAVFRTEGRAEGVDLAQRQRIGLGI